MATLPLKASCNNTARLTLRTVDLTN